MSPHPPTPDLAILGGTGFVGGHFVAAATRQGRRVRMLVRAAATDAVATNDLVTRVGGDLGDPGALRRLITPGATVVNFAWSGLASPDDAVRQARQLATACRETGAGMLLHCSTASVFGGCDGASVIRDDTVPRPADDYGRLKLAVDDMLRQELQGRLPLALLRPTSIFGAGGRSLVKMFAELSAGGALANYLRSSLFDQRLMHLVPIDTVVAAFLFVEAGVGIAGCHHLIAADHEPLNRYRAMEQRLRPLFGLPDHRWPRLPLPPAALRLALSAGRRVAALPFTPFDDDGLRALGFAPPVAFAEAVDSFATWYRAQPDTAPPRRPSGAAS